MHGIRVWRASLLGALEAQQSLTASSIPSSAWCDPARIELEGYISSVDPHAVKHDGNLASDSDDSSLPALGLHQPHAPGLKAVPGD
jgi:hypothetical protein